MVSGPVLPRLGGVLPVGLRASYGRDPLTTHRVPFLRACHIATPPLTEASLA
jgi:hypothetical protein